MIAPRSRHRHLAGALLALGAPLLLMFGPLAASGPAAAATQPSTARSTPPSTPPSTSPSTSAGTPPATFDWPLDCPATVTQRYSDADLAVDVSFEVAAVEAGTPGVVAVEFGPAAVDSIAGTELTEESAGQLAAFFTNPLLEVDSDGSPVEAVGFEEWLEAFTAAGADGSEPDELERDIVQRAVEVTWESWVGLWSDLPAFDGDVLVDDGDGGAVTWLAERTVEDQVVSFELVADPATLVPEEAAYEARSLDGDVVVAYEWTFEWSDCGGDHSAADLDLDAADPDGAAVASGFETVTVDELPPEALGTLALIDAGGPFPYRQDGAVFENREGLLPDRPFGYYREYTVETPGSDDRGARRIVTGSGGELFYTDDHYDSFRAVIR